MENKISRSVLTVAVMMAATVLSKGAGLLRSVLMASRYGTGQAANAFSEALHIPLTFFDLLFSAAIVGCFIPVYNSLPREKGENDTFACVFLNTMLLFSGVLAIGGVLLADPLISLMAPGFDGETHALAVRLLRILFPMVLFTAGTYTLVGLMQSKGRYFLPSMISLISNGIVILYFLVTPDDPEGKQIYVLAVMYLVAWLCQFLTLAIPLRAGGFRFRALLNFRDPHLRRALRMTPPILLGSWLHPAGLLIGLAFASGVTDTAGAVTVFDCSNNVYMIIAGIMTYGICNYVFPILSRQAAEDRQKFASTVRSGLQSALVLVLPVLAATILLSGEGISVLYQRGEFTAADAAATARTLRFMAWAMVGFAAVELFSRVCFAGGAEKMPMVAAVTGLAVNVISTLLMTRVFSMGLDGIALGNALGQTVAAGVLIGAVWKRFPGIFDRRLLSSVGKVLLCGAAAFAVMALIRALLTPDPFSAGMLRNIGSALIVFVPGLAVYLGLVRLLRIPFGRAE